VPDPARRLELSRRHYRTDYLTGRAEAEGIPLLHNADLVVGCRQPTEDDATFHLNADADELWFVRSGRGTLRSALGALDCQAGDYVCVPKGCSTA
jgi:homogentisate 1,2-dioxygenase